MLWKEYISSSREAKIKVSETKENMNTLQQFQILQKTSNEYTFDTGKFYRNPVSQRKLC